MYNTLLILRNPTTRHRIPQKPHQCNPTTKPEPALQSSQKATWYSKVVCHKSLISGFAGSVISEIRQQTSCNIRCEQLIQGADHCIIHVGGSDRRKIKISLIGAVPAEKVVSPAQEGVIRILEKMWELDSDDFDNDSGNEGFCGLLSNKTQLGAIMGKGAKHIIGMRRYSGADIEILPPPFCAAENEELIQITGGKLAVTKAVIMITNCLQDCPAFTELPTVPRQVDLFPYLSSLLPHLTPADVDSKHSKTEVYFQLLCSNAAAGSIIGMRGTIVRALQNITGASIVFDSLTNLSDGRIVTVSALEDVETEYSPAQNAAVFVFARSVEHEIESGRPRLTPGSIVTAKLLVESGVVFCLGGNGERIDSEISHVSGAEIRVLEEERVLDSSRSEVVVQISGEYRNVQSALFLVTSRIRNLFSNVIANEVRKRDLYGRERQIASPTSQLSAGLCLDSGQEINLTSDFDRLRLSDRKIDPLSVSHPPQKLGTYTSNNNDNGSLANFVGATELERSLHFLLPREVLYQVDSRNSNGEVKANASSGLHLPSGSSYPKPSVGASSIQGHQADLSGRINCSATGMQPLKDAGREDIIANQGTEKESTTSESSGKPERKRGASVANTTLELIVSDDLIRDIYGENGSNLENLRKTSGAKIEVLDPTPGKREAMVVISGRPDETMLAESLIRAFI